MARRTRTHAWQAKANGVRRKKVAGLKRAGPLRVRGLLKVGHNSESYISGNKAVGQAPYNNHRRYFRRKFV